MQDRSDVVIIGAGPYGLSAAAHLKALGGLTVRVFGETMEFWRQNMPAGMFLRSPWSATHIADPNGTLSLDAYTAARKKQLSKPIPLDDFIDYGEWFQGQAAPDLDRRKIRKVESEPKGFRLTTSDGEVINTKRVVVATGIAPFAWRPPEFEGLPKSLVSHACDHSDLSRFKGKHVAVVGAGQSALESAALLHEAGADVEIIIRNPQIRGSGGHQPVGGPARYIPIFSAQFAGQDWAARDIACRGGMVDRPAQECECANGADCAISGASRWPIEGDSGRWQ